MEIKISGTPKEIADLALELQNRRTVTLKCDSHELAKQVMKGIDHIRNQSKKSDEPDFVVYKFSEEV